VGNEEKKKQKFPTVKQTEMNKWKVLYNW